jgi:hypothetical protein
MGARTIKEKLEISPETRLFDISNDEFGMNKNPLTYCIYYEII